MFGYSTFTNSKIVTYDDNEKKICFDEVNIVYLVGDNIPKIIFPNVKELKLSTITLNDEIIEFITNHIHINKLFVKIKKSNDDMNIKFIELLNRMHLDELIIHNWNIGNKYYLLNIHIKKIIIVISNIKPAIKYHLENPVYDISFCSSSYLVNNLIQLFAFEPNHVVIKN